MSIAETAKAAVSVPEKGNGNGKTPKNFIGMTANSIAGMIDAYRPMMAQVLPKTLPPERMIQICASIIASKPELKGCTAASVLGAIVSASILGLDPTPELQLVYFIPRDNFKKSENAWVRECTFMIGAAGWKELILRNGGTAKLSAHVVRENDQFEVILGDEERILHKPNLDNPGEMKYVYCTAHLDNGQKVFRYMNREQVYARRDRSSNRDKNTGKMKDSSPWAGDFEEEMWIKTAIRHIRKFMRISPQAAQAAAIDDKVIDVGAINTITKTFDLEKIDKQSKVEEPTETSQAEEAKVIEEKEAKPESAAKPAESAGPEPAKAEPKGNGNGNGKKKVVFLKTVMVHQAVIEPIMGAEFWRNLPGQLGYENFEQVPESDFDKVLKALADESTHARKVQQAQKTESNDE
jgi:recombination protein RecT